MNKKQLSLGVGAAAVAVGLLFQRPPEQSSQLTEEEVSRVFGGQSGTCYQNAPTSCPGSSNPSSCSGVACSTQNMTCNEDGRMVTYTACFCPTPDYIFNQITNGNYQSAANMGQNATNGNEGQTQVGQTQCGSSNLCTGSSTCDNLCSACSLNASGTLVCNTYKSNAYFDPVYAPDPNTPACPQQMGSIRDRIPDSLLAVAWHNGALYELGN